MTPSAIAKCLSVISECYPGRFTASMATTEVWSKMLTDIDDKYGKAAVVQLCTSGQWPPTIAEIRETALTLTDGDVVPPSPWEAWERVVNGRVETDIEKRALKLIGGTWEIKHTENQGVTRSNFVKAYGELVERDRRRRQRETDCVFRADQGGSDTGSEERYGKWNHGALGRVSWGLHRTNKKTFIGDRQDELGTSRCESHQSWRSGGPGESLHQ
jgi:hypothetical protein